MKRIAILIIVFIMFLVFMFYFLKWKRGMRKRLKLQSLRATQLKNESEGGIESKRICLVTLETRPSKMLNIHNENIQKYADKYGYKYIFLNNYENKLNLPIYWKKLQLLSDVLANENCDYAMWLDSDTIVVNDDIRLETILDNEHSIYIGYDEGWPLNEIYSPLRTFNAGVFIIKNSEEGKAFLNDCINTYINREKCIDDNGNYTLNSAWSKDCYEQGVMNELLSTSYKPYLKVLDDHIFTNSSIPDKNCFILHLFTGRSIFNIFSREQKKGDTEYREKYFSFIINNK